MQIITEELLNTQIKASLAILGGGKGVRMGGNKLFLSSPSGLLICDILSRLSPLFAQTLLSVSANLTDEKLKILSPIIHRYEVKTVFDKRDDIGPLEGLVRCLEESAYEWIFLMGCDMPFVQEAVVRAMWAEKNKFFSENSANFDAVIFRMNGHFEPLHAFYNKSCLEEAKNALQNGKRHVKSFYENIKLNIIEENQLSYLPHYKKSFENVNNPYDLIKVRHMN